MAYPYNDPSGGKIAFYSQREQAPALAKARRGLQFGMTAYSPYENPSERDARARELLSGYGEGLGNIQLAGTRAGQSLWGQKESLAAAERDRTENTRRWEAEMELRRRTMGTTGGSSTSLPINQLRLMGLQEREQAPSGFRPDYGQAMGAARYDIYDPANNPQWSKGPGTTDPNWKKPIDRLTSTVSAPPVQAGLKKSFMPEVGGQTKQLGTVYSPGYNKPLTAQHNTIQAGYGYGDLPMPSTPTIYGAGSEEAYRKAMDEAEVLGGLSKWGAGGGKTVASSGYTASGGRTY